MVFTTVNSIEFTFRKYRNMKMAIWHITTHFVVEGHKLGTQKKTNGEPQKYSLGTQKNNEPQTYSLETQKKKKNGEPQTYSLETQKKTNGEPQTYSVRNAEEGKDGRSPEM